MNNKLLPSLILSQVVMWFCILISRPATLHWDPNPDPVSGYIVKVWQDNMWPPIKYDAKLALIWRKHIPVTIGDNIPLTPPYRAVIVAYKDFLDSSMPGGKWRVESPSSNMVSWTSPYGGTPPTATPTPIPIPTPAPTPGIRVYPTMIHFDAVVGGPNPSPQIIEGITSDGLPYTTDDTNPWCNAIPHINVNSATSIKLIPDSQGWPAGNYNNHIIFRSAAGIGVYPVTDVPVTMTIGASRN